MGPVRSTVANISGLKWELFFCGFCKMQTAKTRQQAETLLSNYCQFFWELFMNLECLLRMFFLNKPKDGLLSRKRKWNLC